MDAIICLPDNHTALVHRKPGSHSEEDKGQKKEAKQETLGVSLMDI